MNQNPKSKIQNPKLDYGLLLALIVPLPALLPLLTHPGLPNTADGPAHLMRQVELNQAWQQGLLYPRWGTDLALGHGMPIFSYAPPALYQATQLFHLAGLPLDAAMKAVLVVTFLLYSLGMFLLVRRIFGPAPALVAAAVYVYAPYRLREAYIQGNYGQFLGLACYPLIFWAFHGLITDGRPRYLIAAPLSLAALLFSHNISSMLFAPLFAAYLLFLLILTATQQNARDASQEREHTDTPRTHRDTQRDSKSFLRESLRKNFLFKGLVPLLRTLVAGLLGLGLATIFWLPAFGERHDIKLEGITQGFFDFRENFIAAAEFFAPPVLLDLSAINPEFPLSLGLPQIIGATLGLLSLIYGLYRLVSPRSPAPLLPCPPAPLTHTLFFSLALLLYTYLALPISQAAWEAVPLLELAEFPWRMLGPAIFCAAILSAAAFATLTNPKEWRGSDRSLTAPGAKSHGSGRSPTASGVARSGDRPQPHEPHPTPYALRNHWPSYLLPITLLLIIALNLPYLYPSQFIPWGTPTPAEAFAYEVTSGAIGTTSTGEFLPRWAEQHPQPDTLWPDYAAGRPPQRLDPATLPAGASVETISHLAETDRLRIETPQSFQATLRTLYWPGWQLYLNEVPHEFSVIAQTGLIQTTIPAGQHTLTLQLESTPLRTTGRWLTLVSAVVVVLIAGFTLKRRPSIAPSNVYRLSTTDYWPLSPRLFLVTTVLLLAAYLLSRPLAPLLVRQSDPNRPIPADELVQVDFDDQLRLVGLDNLPQTITLAEDRPTDLVVIAYWRALRELETNYAVFAHLDALNGQTIATVDEVHPENIPTRNWPPGLYLRNPLHLEIPADAPPLRYDLNLGVYNRESGERLAIGSAQTAFTAGSLWLLPAQPASVTSPVAHFGPAVTLHQPSLVGDSLTLVWQTEQPLPSNLTLFIHLLDANGVLLAQLDGSPYAGLYPLENWLPGQPITDQRTLPVLNEPGRLSAVAVGVYDLNSGTRLPATGAQGQPLPNDSYIIPVTASP